jgi:glycosyltransferase involved in cell wall biosynthesis
MCKLSICIPTYNRISMLKECLEHLIPQIAHKDNVEVVISDNASTDGTGHIVKGFIEAYPELRYYENTENLGYARNQIKLFHYASGDYIAVLCDDDVYMDGHVDAILKVISEHEYALVYTNYYSFISKPDKPLRKVFAPEKDKVFTRAYDIMNYPSVGHFSGYVFNRTLALKALKDLLTQKHVEYFEEGRSVFGHVAVVSTATSDLPSYFVGRRHLAAREPSPDQVDYDRLHHLCLDYYEIFHEFFKEGVISEKDLAYRADMVLSSLPRSIIRDAPQMTNEQLKVVAKRLSDYFREDRRFYLKSLPLFYIVRISMMKQFLKLLLCLHHAQRRLRRSLD